MDGDSEDLEMGDYHLFWHSNTDVEGTGCLPYKAETLNFSC